MDNTEDRSGGSGDDKHTEGVGPGGLLDQVMQGEYDLSNGETDENRGGKAKFVLIETPLMAPIINGSSHSEIQPKNPPSSSPKGCCFEAHKKEAC